MSKKAIVTLYICSVVFTVISIIAIISVSLFDNWRHTTCSTCTAYSVYVQTENVYLQREDVSLLVAGGGAIVAIVLGMIAWIGALINLSRAQAWAWFVLMFFFGGMMLFLYMIGGPRPIEVEQDPEEEEWSSTSLPYQASQSISALEILQQRYARGEIDAATFARMRVELGS